MAEKLFLVTKAHPEYTANTLVDNITGILINADDGHSDAEVIAHAVAKCVAAHHPVRTGYFDTVAAIADLSAGILGADLSAVLICGRNSSATVI